MSRTLIIGLLLGYVLHIALHEASNIVTEYRFNKCLDLGKNFSECVTLEMTPEKRTLFESVFGWEPMLFKYLEREKNQ